MSLIPFPNVPALPGVPALHRIAPYVSAGLTLAAEFLPLNLFGQRYAIMNADTMQYALIPDSVVAFDFKQEAKIPIYPMQNGAFQSYNKVGLPWEVRMTVTCSGNGTMSQSDFLSAIQSLLANLTLVDIQVPNYTYQSGNLVHVDYRRESTKGATLIIAQLYFQWVRVVSGATNNAAQPSGASPISLGNLSPQISPSAWLLSKLPSIS